MKKIVLFCVYIIYLNISSIIIDSIENANGHFAQESQFEPNI